jgi:hypothetical protein
VVVERQGEGATRLEPVGLPHERRAALALAVKTQRYLVRRRVEERQHVG